MLLGFESMSALALLDRAEVRALLAALTAFAVSLVFGRWFIPFLERLQVLERTEKGDSPELRVLHGSKRSTPTMGGVIILAAVTSSTLLWASPASRYVQLLLGITLAFGAIGFIDDAIKLRSSRKGLSARTKLLAQVAVAGVAGVLLQVEPLEVGHSLAGSDAPTALFFPFIKAAYVPLGVLHVLLVVVVTAGASNAVNLTDGLDGLAAGCSTLVAVTFVAVALLGGHEHSSALLEIPYVAGGHEVAVFAAALAGAGLGFLWFNCHPAQVFMGDTGALALGGSIGLVAVLCKQELLLVLAGGVLVAEALSVIVQVGAFKATGRRVFRCAPLHHHFELKGWAETKVTVRFWLAAAAFASASLAALRM